MKRTVAILLAAVVVAVLFAGLVYAVLLAAHTSEAAPTTVHGVTLRRLWATAAALLALAAVASGCVALYRGVRRTGKSGRLGALVALVAGPIAGINGGLNLAVATGGPGTGNGVVGGAVAFVLGLIAIVLGWIALTRSRRMAIEQGA